MTEYYSHPHLAYRQPPSTSPRHQQSSSAPGPYHPKRFSSPSPIKTEIQTVSRDFSPQYHTKKGGDERNELEIEIDYQTIEQTMKGQEYSGKRDLDTFLPKLAKRIQTNQVKVGELDNPRNSPSSLSPTASKAVEGENAGAKERRRVSMTRSGSVAFKPSPELPPEVEELRTRDIEPDENSAADQALKAAAMFAQNHPQTSSHHRRSSLMDSQKTVVEGREIQQDHAQYALTYGMMLGIRVTTGRRDVDLDLLSSSKSLSAILEEQELTSQDYNSTTELVFKPEGNSLPPFPTPPHKLSFTFTFKDYMTNVFRAVRALSNIEEADYMLSLAGDFNYIEFIANSKSGQFFFYSHDGKYMIKTQSKEESKLLRKIMPLYIQHLTLHPDSLLVRFYGMHRVKMKSLRSKTYFVIMSSVFNTPKPINIKYDLKGSTVGRLTAPEDCRAGAVQKDLNLMESGNRIKLGEPNIDIFYETLKADVTFLKDLNIMDYSLLLGIHRVNSRTGVAPSRRRSSGVILSSRSSVRMSVSQTSPTSATSAPESPRFPEDAGSRRMSTNRRMSQEDPWEGHRDSFVSDNPMHFGSSLFNSYYGGIKSTPETCEVYFMGIIDILQVYNASKQMENFFKGFTHDRKQLSAVDPALYAERMLNFIMQHTDYPEIMQKRKIAQKAGKVKVNALSQRSGSRGRMSNLHNRDNNNSRKSTQSETVDK